MVEKYLSMKTNFPKHYMLTCQPITAFLFFIFIFNLISYIISIRGKIQIKMSLTFLASLRPFRLAPVFFRFGSFLNSYMTFFNFKNNKININPSILLIFFPLALRDDTVIILFLFFLLLFFFVRGNLCATSSNSVIVNI